MNNTATALVFLKAGAPLEKKTINIPTPGANEIIVAITYTTICTSDLHTYNGRRSSPCPCVLGHEIIGVIQNLGSGIKYDYNGATLKVGDRVTWSVYAYNDEDEMAKRGMPQKSEGLYKYGHHKFTENDGLNGGFATHCLLKEGTTVFKLPDTITTKEAAPINCTHATIAGALRLAGAVDGKNVLITGTGMLGLSACAMATVWHAKNVYTLDNNEGRLDFSRKFGTVKTFNGNMTVDEINGQLSKTEKIDIVIDTTGVPNVMQKGLELLSIGGIAVWVGAVYSQPATCVDAEMVVRKILTIKGLHNYTPEDLSFAIKFIESSRLKFPFEKLVGTDYQLCELEEAFKTANKGLHYRVGIKP